MSFSHQSKCFSEARSALMLPFPAGVDVHIAQAFHDCRKALDGLQYTKIELDDEVLNSIKAIERIMDTTGLEDPLGIGTFRVKARNLSTEEQAQFSHAVSYLAFWFDCQHLGSKR